MLMGKAMNYMTFVQARIMILITPLFLLMVLQDHVVPDEWALFAIYHWINTNGCNANIYIDDWVMSGMPEIGGEYSDWECLDFFIPHVLSSGDTLSQNNHSMPFNGRMVVIQILA